MPAEYPGGRVDAKLRSRASPVIEQCHGDGTGVGRLPAGACCSRWRSRGGCSFSYQLDNLFAKRTTQDRSDRLAAAGRPQAGAETPAEADLAIARAAVSEVLAKGGKDTEHALGEPEDRRPRHRHAARLDLQQDGVTCRDFLASYVKNGSESWLQGEACRAERGKWEVRNLRPWKQHLARGTGNPFKLSPPS